MSAFISALAREVGRRAYLAWDAFWEEAAPEPTVEENPEPEAHTPGLRVDGGLWFADRPLSPMHGMANDKIAAVRAQSAMSIVDEDCEGFVLFTVKPGREDGTLVNCNAVMSHEFWPQVVEALDHCINDVIAPEPLA